MSVVIDTVIRHRTGVILEGVRSGVGFRALLTGTGVGPGDIDRCVEVFRRTLAADAALTPAQVVSKYTDLTIPLGSITVQAIQGRS